MEPARKVKFLKDNGLSVAFFVLFGLCFVGQVLAGFALHAEDPAGTGPVSGRWAVLIEPTFLRGVFGNWQAALLQLLALILLTVVLRQKGAAHSRKSEEEVGADLHDRHLHWFGRSRSWAYGNSLSLAFAALFLLTFVAYVLSEWRAYNASRMRLAEAEMDLPSFFTSADLWFNTLQTWQAEFFAMGVFLVCSVFLRQEGSAESKPVGASDENTGDTNH